MSRKGNRCIFTIWVEVMTTRRKMNWFESTKIATWFTVFKNRFQSDWDWRISLNCTRSKDFTSFVRSIFSCITVGRKSKSFYWVRSIIIDNWTYHSHFQIHSGATFLPIESWTFWIFWAMPARTGSCTWTVNGSSTSQPSFFVSSSGSCKIQARKCFWGSHIARYWKWFWPD